MKNRVSWLICMAFLTLILAGIVVSRIESRDEIIFGGAEGAYVQTDTYQYKDPNATPEVVEVDDGWPEIDITQASTAWSTIRRSSCCRPRLNRSAA